MSAIEKNGLLTPRQIHDVRLGSKPDMRASNVRSSSRHKAANLGVAVTVVIGPHNGRAETVGLGYNGVVRHDEPLSIDAHTIVSILGIPIDILHTEAVGKRTAQAL